MPRRKKYKTEEERKEAIAARNRRWKKRNPEYVKKYRKIWRERNPEKHRFHSAKYARNKREKISQYQKIWAEKKEVKKVDKKYVSLGRPKKEYTDPKKRLERVKFNAWRKKRLKSDINYKIATHLRTSLYKILKKENVSKNNKTLKLLGVKIKYFKKYLEHRFKSGMTWDNHGIVWHLDHIIPVSAIDLSTDANLKFAFHYRNFQPLLARENIKKSNNIFIPIEPHIQMWEVDIIVKKILKKLKPELDIDLDMVDGGILIKVLKKYKKGKLN